MEAIAQRHSKEQWPILLTVDESCGMLRIGRSKMYDIMTKGLLKPVRIGRSVRFRLRDLEDFASRSVSR